MWGLVPHQNVSFWWGARVIFNPPDILDIVPDRQQIQGGTTEDRDKLVSWINSVGIRKLRDELAKQCISGSEDKLIAIDDKTAGFMMMANPKQSYGYLYISAMPYSNV